jgi:hypothetical protein
VARRAPRPDALTWSFAWSLGRWAHDFSYLSSAVLRLYFVDRVPYRYSRNDCNRSTLRSVYINMKLLHVVAQLFLTALIYTAAGDRADSVLDIIEIDRPLNDEEGKLLSSPVVGVDTPPPPTPTPSTPEDDTWDKIRCRGKDLVLAMTLNQDDCTRLLGWHYGAGIQQMGER